MGFDLSNLDQLPANELGPASAFVGVPAQQREPYPLAGEVLGYANDLNDNYNALQVKLEWRNWHGLTALTSYTYGQSLGIQNYQYIQETSDKGQSYGPSAGDLPNVFVQSFTYALPVGPGKKWDAKGGVLDQFVGGSHVNGILTLRSGLPVLLLSSEDLTGNASSENSVGTIFPDRLCNGALPASQRSLQEWFNIGCLAIPQPYTYGNSAVFPVRGPGMFDLDLSASKRFRITESKQLEFRAEAFNFTNTPGFGNPDGTIGAPGAGTITTLANQNRKIQFALKFLF
jgi:hypothetical protein